MGMMPQFFFAHRNDDIVQLDKDDSHHALHVLRMESGDTARLCDAKGNVYAGRLIKTPGHSAVFGITNKISVELPPLELNLFVPKMTTQKIEDVVRAGVELSVSKFFLVHTKNCRAGDVNMSRLERIAKSAACQSGAVSLPPIYPPAKLNHVDLQGEIIVAQPKVANSVANALQRTKARTISIITGPESGFAPDEIQYLQSKGGHIVSLAPGVLRAETAPIAALASVWAVCAMHRGMDAAFAVALP